MNNSCAESNLQLLTSIEAYPLTSIVTDLPLLYEDMAVPAGKVVIGGEGRLEVPFDKRTASVVSRPVFTRAGNLREVELKWTIKNPSVADHAVFRALHKSAKSLIISVFGDKRYYIPGNEESYRFEVSTEEGQAHCELTLQNLCGMAQLI